MIIETLCTLEKRISNSPVLVQFILIFDKTAYVLGNDDDWEQRDTMAGIEPYRHRFDLIYKRKGRQYDHK